MRGAGDAPELEWPSPDAQLVPMASTGEGEWSRDEQEKPAAQTKRTGYRMFHSDRGEIGVLSFCD